MMIAPEADSESDTYRLGECDILSFVSESKKVASGAATLSKPSQTIQKREIVSFTYLSLNYLFNK
jgi:hypothetical protein